MNNLIVKRHHKSTFSNIWVQFQQWLGNTNHPIDLDCWNALIIPTLFAATICSILALTIAPSVDIDDIREPIVASLYCK